MATITTAGSGNWDAGAPWTGGSVPGDGDTASIESGHTCTLTENEQVGAVVLNGGTIVGAGFEITLVKTSGRLCDLSSGTISGNLDLELQGTHTTTEDFMPTTGNLRNINLNGNANQIVTTGRNTVITGTMTVSAGVLITGNDDFTAGLINGTSGTIKTGSGTYTTTADDWIIGTTQFQENGGTFVIFEKMGGTWDCNNKSATIGCRRFNSDVAMINGDGRIADNTQENIVGTATSNEANSAVYGPLQGAWKFVTNSSGTKSFALRENFVIEGRMLITGSGAFTTSYGGVDYDILTTPKTYHNSLTGPSEFGVAGNYHGIEVRDSVDFDTNSSNVILNQALGSELCDDGDFNSGGTGSWVAYSGNTVTNDSNTLKVSRPASGGHANGAYVYLRNNTNLTQDLTIGRTYKVSADFKVSAGASITAGLYKGTLDLNRIKYDRLKTSGGGADQITSTSFETRHAYFVAGSSTGDSPYLYFGLDGGMSNGEDVFVDNISVKEVLPHNDGTHQQSWGFRQFSNTAVNFGDGCLITSGFRVVSNRDVTKGAGDFITNGAGDSTEYWNFGSGTIDMDMGNTYVTTTLNPNEVNTIGYNHSSSDLNLTCTRHNFYAPSSSNHIALWQTVAPTGTTGAKTFTVTGDFYVYKGEFRTGYHAGSRYPMGFTVSGNVIIEGDGTLNCSVDNSTTNVNNENDVDVSFKSLTINSGGTYNAAGGNATTTITDETSGGYGLINSGTFTHNNGKLKIDFNTPNKDAHTIIQVNDLYDLEIDMNASNYEVKFDDTSGNATNILNNLDITQGVFESKDNGDTLTIHGLTRITSNGTFMPDANHDTNKIIHNGLVTNEGTYKINDGTTVKMNAGIRNLGTITVA